MKKYYTPKFYDLILGMDVQVLNNEEWSTAEINSFTDLSMVWQYINKEWLRVKYLDVEDIESLGWNKKDPYSYEKETKDIKYKLSIGDLDQEKGLFVCIYDVEILFYGYIKNKAELQKVQKMIGI